MDSFDPTAERKRRFIDTYVATFMANYKSRPLPPKSYGEQAPNADTSDDYNVYDMYSEADDAWDEYIVVYFKMTH